MRVAVFAYANYEWLTPAFLHFYHKNWADNPYPADFVVTGSIPWADHMFQYINLLKDDSFLLILNDYIIEKPVDGDVVKRAESLCIGDVGCVRLNAHDKLSCYLYHDGVDGFKRYPLDKPYSVSLQVAVWRKEFFLEFLRYGDTIWQTEINGSARIKSSNKKVLWSDKPAFTYVPHGYMQKGVIDINVEQWVKENW